MGWFGEDSEQAAAYEQVTGKAPHTTEWSHQLLAAAASYEAANLYEKHVAANGKPDSHAEAKKIAAGLAGAFIDRVVETKGLDFIDKKKAEHAALTHFEDQLASDY